MFASADIIRGTTVSVVASLTLRYWGGSARFLHPEALIPGGVALFADRIHDSLPDTLQRAVDSLSLGVFPAADAIVAVAGALSYEAAKDVLRLSDVTDLGAWRRMAVGAAAALGGLWLGRRLAAMWDSSQRKA